VRAPLVALLALAACGERVVELDPRTGVDATPCVAGDTQCSNCVDDDDDGQIDGFDIECTGAADDDEASFDTAISGDNQDVARVDCFFDGNSGSGDDGCDLHVCCVLDDCPPGLPGPPFDPTMCTPTQACIDSCEALVPPGCDCLGCCTVCDAAGCEDIYLSPALAPDCDAEALHDPVACPRCAPLAGCGQPCGGTSCILCPGQTVDELPPTCSGTTCPDGGSPCGSSTDCGADRFCAAGCCIATIP
jgi:hypothetical protein